ncbi:MAG: type II secretion system protein [bacterium]
MNTNNIKTVKREFLVCGFTLIELLVVIAIIGILAGLLFPVLKAARDRGKETKARSEVHQLNTALKVVLLDYRVWPSPFSGGGGDVSGNYFKFLNGTNSAGVCYYEFSQVSLAAGAFLDPWKNIYKVVCGDGSVTTPHGTFKRDVAVWSKGQDGLDGTAAQQADDIKSW